jgi:hypothetical protein
MEKETALELIKGYSEEFKKRGLDPIASELFERWPADGSEKKAMRWLGFAQGVAWSNNIYTLIELKSHSMTGRISR